MIWCVRLVSLAVLLTTIEWFWIRPWNWSCMQGELPWILRPLVRDQNLLLILRLLAASLALWSGHGMWVLLMLLTTWFLAVRWRGTFNGGSDAMTMQVLLACVVYAFFPVLEFWCSAYLSVILIFSYFVAGLVKVVRQQWRQGATLKKIGQEYGFRPPAGAHWVVMIFELSFPLAFFFPTPYIFAAMAFHFLVAYGVGLNRFFWAWLAAYPALIVFSGHP